MLSAASIKHKGPEALSRRRCGLAAESELVPVHLTERQQLALALKESRRASIQQSNVPQLKTDPATAVDQERQSDSSEASKAKSEAESCLRAHRSPAVAGPSDNDSSASHQEAVCAALGKRSASGKAAAEAEADSSELDGSSQLNNAGGDQAHSSDQTSASGCSAANHDESEQDSIGQGVKTLRGRREADALALPDIDLTSTRAQRLAARQSHYFSQNSSCKSSNISLALPSDWDLASAQVEGSLMKTDSVKAPPSKQQQRLAASKLPDSGLKRLRKASKDQAPGDDTLQPGPKAKVRRVSHGKGRADASHSKAPAADSSDLKALKPQQDPTPQLEDPPTPVSILRPDQSKVGSTRDYQPAATACPTACIRPCNRPGSPPPRHSDLPIASDTSPPPAVPTPDKAAEAEAFCASRKGKPDAIKVKVFRAATGSHAAKLECPEPLAGDGLVRSVQSAAATATAAAVAAAAATAVLGSPQVATATAAAAVPDKVKVQKRARSRVPPAGRRQSQDLHGTGDAGRQPRSPKVSQRSRCWEAPLALNTPGCTRRLRSQGVPRDCVPDFPDGAYTAEPCRLPAAKRSKSTVLAACSLLRGGCEHSSSVSRSASRCEDAGQEGGHPRSAAQPECDVAQAAVRAALSGVRAEHDLEGQRLERSMSAAQAQDGERPPPVGGGLGRLEAGQRSPFGAACKHLMVPLLRKGARCGTNGGWLTNRGSSAVQIPRGRCNSFQACWDDLLARQALELASAEALQLWLHPAAALQDDEGEEVSK